MRWLPHLLPWVLLWWTGPAAGGVFAAPPSGDSIFLDGFETGDICHWSVPTCSDPNTEFPVATSAAQEPVEDDVDADAAATYPSGGSVVLNSGEQRLDRTDLLVPGRGQIHFQLSRRYRSRIDYDGPLGFGWDFTYNERLIILGNGDVLRANGRGHVDLWMSIGGGEYLAPVGFFGTLTEEPDGTFILRQADGFKRTFSAGGRLLRHEDRFGNRMAFGYDSTDHLTVVTDAFGRVFRLFYQYAAGRLRLTTLRDFSGREVHYTYDGKGDLVEVTGPAVAGTSTGNDFPTGRTERYTYSTGHADAELNHDLLTITRPEEVATGGPPVVTCTYSVDAGIAHDRVILMTVGGTNASGVAAGGTTTFVWQELNAGLPPGHPEVPRIEVSVTERNGNGRVYAINELQHLISFRQLTRGLRPGEPAYYETRYTYDADGQETSRLFPEGNRVEYSYDASGHRAAQRNLIEIRHVADLARGGGEDLVTTMTYEPVFNQLSTLTEPRGNATGFTPPIGAASAARYTTRYFYDYQEGGAPVPDAVRYGIDLTGTPRNLGDLNGDGATDRLAGNRVRTEEPTVTLLPGSNEALRLGDTSQPILTQMQWNDRGQPIATVDAEGNLTTYSYYSENDPDGDGNTVPGVVSTATRGYLRSVTEDAAPAPARRTALAPPAILETLLGYDAIGNLTSRRNPRSVVTLYEVNQLNEVVVETRGAEISGALASGQLITGESAFGYRDRNTFDFNGRVIRSETENRTGVSTTTGVGDWVERTFTYDILDNLVASSVEVDDATTAVTQYRYDGNELPILLQRPAGNMIKADYDERNLPFRKHSGFGAPEVAVVEYDYDLNGNLRREIDAEDNDGNAQPEATLYTYDGFDRRTMVTDPLGNETIVTYDVASNAVRIQVMGHRANQPLSGNVLLADRILHRDELDRAYRQDDVLFLAPGFDPLRPVDLRDHDADGKVTTVTEFDALSRRTFQVEDDGDLTQWVFDGAGRVVETIDALGNRLAATYDKNGNLVQEVSTEVSPEGLVTDEVFTTSHVYDQLDRLVRTTDNAGRTTRLAYDSRDNRTTTSDEVGPGLVFDPLGLYPGSINGPGNTITLHYDGRDLPVREVSDLRVGGRGDGALDTSNQFNPDGQISVQFLYDLDSRIVGTIDDNGNTTGYAYDALDRVISQTNADSTEYHYGWDRDSNLVTVLDPNANQISNDFDVLNRLVQRNITRATGVVGTTVEIYSYDGLSRLTSSTDNNGSAATSHSVDRFYDSLSRLIEEQEDGEPHSSIWSGDGNRLQLLYPTSRILEYQYDAINRIKRVVEPFPAPPSSITKGTALTVADYSWVGGGECCTCGCSSRPLLISFGNATQLSFLDGSGALDVGYNEAKEVVGLRHLMGGSPFVDRSYTYNRASMRTSEGLLELAGAPFDAFTLDSTYRVTDSFLDAEDSPEAYSTLATYSLDGAGNRRQVDFTQDFGDGNVAQFTDNYLSNEMNEYDDAGGGPRGHDDNGNLAAADGFLYAYDYRNRLVEVRRQTDQVILASYEYDTFNRRVKKTIYDLANPGTVISETRFLYDDWNVIEEWGTDADYSLNGPLATYVYGTGLDHPLQTTTSVSAPYGAGQFYYHQDARENVVAMTDAAGAVVEQTRYDDFGNFSQEVSIGNPYLYQGRRYDSETGLFYYRNRYYSPRTGRFLQRDPLADPLNRGNLYSFVGNNPVSNLDPYGLIASTVIVRPKYTATGTSRRTLDSGVAVRVRGETTLHKDPKNSARGADPIMNVEVNCRADSADCKGGCERVIADRVTLELWVDITYADGDPATAKHEMQHAVQIRSAVQAALDGVADFRSPCKNAQGIQGEMQNCTENFKKLLAETAKGAAINKSQQLGGAGTSRHAHRNSRAEREADEAAGRDTWPADIPRPTEFEPPIPGPNGAMTPIDPRLR